jgi:vacuolar protein-sorting-associated protein 4
VACAIGDDYHPFKTYFPLFSGADIGVLVRDAIMVPIRKVQGATHFKQLDVMRGDPPALLRGAWMPCSPGDAGAVEKSWSQIDPKLLVEPSVDMVRRGMPLPAGVPYLQSRGILQTDMLRCLDRSKPTVSPEDLGQLQEWTDRFGSEG